MTTYGVISTGFLAKPLSVIIDEITTEMQDTISQSLDLSATEPMGQTIGILSDKIHQLWETAEETYKAAYPDSASGSALDEVASLNAINRVSEATSTVTLDHIFLDTGTTVPVHSNVTVGESGAAFRTLSAVTNATGVDATYSVLAESVDTGPVQGLAGTIDTIETSVTGWNATAAITNDTAETYDFTISKTLSVEIDEGDTQYLTISSGVFPTPSAATAAQVAARIDAHLTGGTAAAVGTKIRIYSDTDGTGSAVQVTGGTANTVLDFPTDLIKGFNTLDAVLGNNEQTDPEFRQYRIELLRRPGAGTASSILSNVRAVENVTKAIILENWTMNDPDVWGLPAKSFEVLAVGGAGADIAQAIFDKKDAGIEPHGDLSETVADSEGTNHTVKYSRPTEVDLYVIISITVDLSLYPTDGDDQVEEAITGYGTSLAIGHDSVTSKISSLVMEVDGVIDVSSVLQGITNPPTSSVNYPIVKTELAMFDTARITVVAVSGSLEGV
ncbi:MAG: hypothetical protein GY847_06505 [Proteobacteria bacterium]|nr:hypothetical protein [Pseudomonadota bacterium]